jgi:hypothetical protein
LVDSLVPAGLHLLNVQVFKRNELVFVDQLAGCLVGEVAPYGAKAIKMVLVGAARLAR